MYVCTLIAPVPRHTDPHASYSIVSTSSSTTRAVVLTGGQFCPSRRYLAKSGDIFANHNWTGEWELLAGTLLNILKCTGQPHDKEFCSPKCQ